MDTDGNTQTRGNGNNAFTYKQHKSRSRLSPHYPQGDADHEPDIYLPTTKRVRWWVRKA